MALNRAYRFSARTTGTNFGRLDADRGVPASCKSTETWSPTAGSYRRLFEHVIATGMLPAVTRKCIPTGRGYCYQGRQGRSGSDCRSSSFRPRPAVTDAGGGGGEPNVSAAATAAASALSQLAAEWHDDGLSSAGAGDSVPVERAGVRGGVSTAAAAAIPERLDDGRTRAMSPLGSLVGTSCKPPTEPDAAVPNSMAFESKRSWTLCGDGGVAAASQSAVAATAPLPTKYAPKCCMRRLRT